MYGSKRCPCSRLNNKRYTYFTRVLIYTCSSHMNYIQIRVYDDNYYYLIVVCTPIRLYAFVLYFFSSSLVQYFYIRPRWRSNTVICSDYRRVYSQYKYIILLYILHIRRRWYRLWRYHHSSLYRNRFYNTYIILAEDLRRAIVVGSQRLGGGRRQGGATWLQAFTTVQLTSLEIGR